MRRRIHLHGTFAGFHDGPIEIIADTVWEAVEAMTRQIPGFQPDAIQGRKIIQVVGYDTVDALKTYDQTTEDIHVLPALVFGKNGGLIQTIIGVTLIVASILIPAGPWTPYILSAGISFTIGGVMQMISPQPQLNAGTEDEVRSKYLSSSVNTVAIGTTVPLLYGLHRVGGHILSMNIDSTDTGL